MKKKDKIDGLFDEEWVEWYKMTPAQRWAETQKLWDFYIKIGGSLDPESDTQSPFHTAYSQGKISSNRQLGLHILRRSRV